VLRECLILLFKPIMMEITSQFTVFKVECSWFLLFLDLMPLEKVNFSIILKHKILLIILNSWDMQQIECGVHKIQLLLIIIQITKLNYSMLITRCLLKTSLEVILLETCLISQQWVKMLMVKSLLLLFKERLFLFMELHSLPKEILLNGKIT